MRKDILLSIEHPVSNIYSQNCLTNSINKSALLCSIEENKTRKILRYITFNRETKTSVLLRVVLDFFP